MIAREREGYKKNNYLYWQNPTKSIWMAAKHYIFYFIPYYTFNSMILPVVSNVYDMIIMFSFCCNSVWLKSLTMKKQIKEFYWSSLLLNKLWTLQKKSADCISHQFLFHSDHTQKKYKWKKRTNSMNKTAQKIF